MKVNLTADLVTEWAYRYIERVRLMCEDRKPSPATQRLAEQEANEWLAEELTYKAIDAELPI